MFFKRKKDNNKLSDLELLDLYKSGQDSVYAGELFHRYSHLVFGVCMKYLKNEEESRDAVMNIFEKLLQDLKKHEIGNFKSWLHTVSRNHCLMFLRSRQQKVEINSEESIMEVMEFNYSLHLYNDNEPQLEVKLGNLDDCMKKLIGEQKICVELFFLEEKCYKEITELTDYTLNEVKSYIQNGKRNLKNCLSRNDENA
jgi:RNA polymerase sigma factor (sigma-70 family)